MKQNWVFAILYVGYFLNVYIKRSVTFALPEIAKSEELDKNQLGRFVHIAACRLSACSKLLHGIVPSFFVI